MTDEQIIEAMAKAIWDDDWGMPDYDEEITTRVRNRCRVKARAALVVVKPLIREQALREAADVAKQRQPTDDFTDLDGNPYLQLRWMDGQEISEAILALVPEKPR